MSLDGSLRDFLRAMADGAKNPKDDEFLKGVITALEKPACDVSRMIYVFCDGRFDVTARTGEVSTRPYIV